MPDSKTTTKAFQVICSLTVAERKQLIRFLQSPYFNSSPTLLKLGELFVKEAEQSSSGQYDRNTIWRKLTRKQTFNDTLFRKHCSDLYKLVETFLVVERLMQNNSRKQLEMYEAVVQKRIEPLYQSALNAARQAYASKPFHTSGDYLEGFHMEKAYRQMMQFEVKPTLRSNADELSENLDMFYWIEKLKLSYLLLSQRKTQRFDYQVALLDDLDKIVQALPMDKHPALAIYYYTYLTRKEEENVEHYYKLKELINRYVSLLPMEEALNVFDSATNYCVARLNARDEPFWQEYLELFKIALEKGVYTFTGELAEWRYNNTIGIALRLKEFAWVEWFVEEYKKYLAPDIRENTYNFAMTRIYFHQKKFDILLRKFPIVEFGDINYTLIGKAMLAMAHYEEGSFDLLDTHLDSFKVFVTRHKDMPTDRRVGNLNFIKYVRALTRLSSRDKAAQDKLRKELSENRSSIRNFEWLLEKLEEKSN